MPSWPRKGAVPLVSVIVVTYNGLPYVSRCLDAIYKTEYENMEVIVVDNGSGDGTVAALRERYGEEGLRVIALSENVGPAAARNAAASTAAGKYLALLDNDTVPDPQWLRKAVTRLECDSTLGACQCRLMLLDDPDRFDYVGDFLGSFGFLVQEIAAGTLDVGQAQEEKFILSAKSAGMLVRSDAFRAVDGFDDDYFIYVEETDLGIRLWLAGYKVIYIPGSVVYHEFGTSAVILGERQNFLAAFHGPKNYVRTLLKTLGPGSLARILPIHVSLWLGYAMLHVLRRRYDSARCVIAGLWWNVRHFRETLVLRRAVQARRQLSDRRLFELVGRPNTIREMFGKATWTKPVGNSRIWST